MPVSEVVDLGAKKKKKTEQQVRIPADLHKMVMQLARHYEKPAPELLDELLRSAVRERMAAMAEETLRLLNQGQAPKGRPNS